MNSLFRATAALAMAMALVFAAAARAEIDNARIDIDQSSLDVQYGGYAETDITLSSPNGPITTPVQWEVLANSLPAGLEMIANGDASATIYGTPAFTGTWCFALGATDQFGNQAEARVCYTSRENDALSYPRFIDDRYLKDATINQFYGATINIQPASVQQLQGFVYGEAPAGLRIVPDQFQYRFNLQGTFAAVQTLQFALQIRDGLSGAAPAVPGRDVLRPAVRRLRPVPVASASDLLRHRVSLRSFSLAMRSRQLSALPARL